jgi:hypothetical protein
MSDREHERREESNEPIPVPGLGRVGGGIDVPRGQYGDTAERVREHARQEADTDEKTIRRELGDDGARAVGVEDDRVDILDVTEIEREQEDNPTVTVLRIEREIPDPRDGGRTTSTEHASRCISPGCEHVEIAVPRNLWSRLRQHARAEHDTRTRTGGKA